MRETGSHAEPWLPHARIVPSGEARCRVSVLFSIARKRLNGRSLDRWHNAQFLGQHALIHAEVQVDFLLTDRRHGDVHLLRQQAEHHRDRRFQLRRTNAVFRPGSCRRRYRRSVPAGRRSRPAARAHSCCCRWRASRPPPRCASFQSESLLVERSRTRCLPSVSQSESNSMVSSACRCNASRQ